MKFRYGAHMNTKAASRSASGEVHQNQHIYDTELRDQYEPTDNGKVALMHHGEVVMVLNDEGDAYTVGCQQYGLGDFSLVSIGQRPARLGSRRRLVQS